MKYTEQELSEIINENLTSEDILEVCNEAFAGEDHALKAINYIMHCNVNSLRKVDIKLHGAIRDLQKLFGPAKDKMLTDQMYKSSCVLDEAV